MKTHNSNIENGIKSALLKLEDLVREEKIIGNSKLFEVIKELQNQVVKAQNGEIDNIPSD